MAGKIQVEKHDDIAWITIENPSKKNAVTPDMLSQLLQVIADVAVDASARVVVIQGHDGVFCSGFDLSSLPDATTIDDDAVDFPGADVLNQATTAIYNLSKPVIALVQGPCMGAGGEIAAACDFRIGDDTINFCMPPAKLGLVYAADGLARFVNVLGVQNAKRVFLLGEKYRGEEALGIGFLDELTSDAIQRSTELARMLAGNAPMAVQGMKSIINTHLSAGPITESAAIEISALRITALKSADHAEAKQAMQERRRPVFRGN